MYKNIIMYTDMCVCIEKCINKVQTDRLIGYRKNA